LLIAAPYRVPAQFATAGEARLGLAPGVLAHVEFEFGPPEAPFTFAVRAGMASSLYNFRCEDPADLSGCAVWDLAFVGSAELAKRFESGLSIDVAAGPVSKLAVGWAF
jgi:hypothetical protein